MNISKLKQNPRIFTRLFGIEPDKFNQLVESVHPLWIKAEARRLWHPRKIKKGSGRPYALNLQESIAMLLLYTRSYVTHAFLAALFDIHDSRVCRYFARLRLAVESVFNLPRNADLSEDEIIMLVVDATDPIKASKLHPLTQRERDRNKRFSQKRIVVEHVFASLKSFRILADRFRGSLINYHKYFLIVCGLRNLARA